MRLFIGASTIHGAVRPWQRRQAMKVCVFHFPKGAFTDRLFEIPNLVDTL